MTVQLSAFRWVPPFAQGYVRDLWVRWALEEAQVPYETWLIDADILGSDSYLAWQPFGQVPAYRENDIEIFESGAIVLHIAAKSAALSPADEAGRARVTAWVLAAMNSVDPHVQYFLDLAGDPPTEPSRHLRVETMLKRRLADLARWLGDKDYLEGRFTAGDIMMAGVLRELVDSGVLAAYPALDAYRRRCEARPAFGHALDAQMQTFRENTPA